MQRYYQFASWINEFQFVDLGFTSSPFSYTRGRDTDSCIFNHLDRILCNVEWRVDFLKTTDRHLPRYRSNHNPFLIHSEGQFIPQFMCDLSYLKQHGYNMRSLGILCRIYRILLAHIGFALKNFIREVML